MAVAWLNGGAIYQLFVGRWESAPLTTKVLDHLRKLDWQQLKERGFATVYLLGVWDYRAEIVVQEEEGLNLDFKEKRVPSMMGLINHQAVNPWLGKDHDLVKLIEEIHKAGLKVIVDFIPAHTSLSHPWIQEHPDFYCWENDQMVRVFSGDVVKLNYDNPQLREAMIEILKFIARLGVDGVRCDMAHIVPNDFWQTATQTLKGINPEFGFIAEAYPTSRFDYSAFDNLFGSGFDAVYDNGWYENLNSVLFDQSAISFLTGHMTFARERYGDNLIFYMGNHDDPPLRHRQAFEALKDGLFKQQLEAIIAVLFLGNSSIPLIFNGSLHGFSRRLAHHWLELLPTEVNELETPLKKSIDLILKLSVKLRSNETRYTYSFTHDLLEIYCDNDHLGRHLIVVNLKIRHIPMSHLTPTLVGLIHEYTPHNMLPPGEAEVFAL